MRSKDAQKQLALKSLKVYKMVCKRVRVWTSEPPRSNFEEHPSQGIALNFVHLKNTAKQKVAILFPIPGFAGIRLCFSTVLCNRPRGETLCDHQTLKTTSFKPHITDNHYHSQPDNKRFDCLIQMK